MTFVPLCTEYRRMHSSINQTWSAFFLYTEKKKKRNGKSEFHESAPHLNWATDTEDLKDDNELEKFNGYVLMCYRNSNAIKNSW